MRLSFVGELGWELHIPRPACVPVYRAVMAAGAKHGLVNAGYRAIDSLSIEKGARRSGAGRGAEAGTLLPPGLSAPPLSLPPDPLGGELGAGTGPGSVWIPESRQGLRDPFPSQPESEAGKRCGLAGR